MTVVKMKFKKQPSITGLKKIIREMKKKHAGVFEALTNTASSELLLRSENTRLLEEQNQLLIVLAKLKEEQAETNMWYGKAKQTIVENNEELLKLRTDLEVFHNHMSNGTLVPRTERFFLSAGLELCCLEGQNLNTFELDSTVKEITPREVYEIAQERRTVLELEKSKADGIKKLRSTGALISHDIFLDYMRIYIPSVKWKFWKRQISLKEYAIAQYKRDHYKNYKEN